MAGDDDAAAADGGVRRVLVVTAHPDDVDFGAAGTVARWTDEGIEVTYCVVTDGDAGGHDLTVDRGEMSGIRRAEQTAAAKEVGVTDLRWLGYPDGQLMVSLQLRHDIARVIRQVRPQRVVSPWPERNWESVFASHPDHMAAGEATLAAVYPDARNPFAFPDLLAAGLAPHIVDEVWVMSAPHPDTFVDVTDTFERKLAALRRHVSQMDPNNGEMGGWLRSYLAANAAAGGLPEGRLAETFLRRVTGENRS
ncbi:MAG TPA: PIG-L deacetylase family protein [Acidimicrobiales bacterium]|jgi:LmbE family N-acetylglucosaminyl deacetylase|nr:PIG-L deacetylase family protein [Acidimicrobiales bacterium]